MRVYFRHLEDYLEKYGYPRNEFNNNDYFDIPDMTAYEYLMNNIKKYEDVDAMTFFGRKIKYNTILIEIAAANCSLRQ